MGQRSVEEMLEAVRRQEALIRQRKGKLQARLTAQQKQRPPIRHLIRRGEVWYFRKRVPERFRVLGVRAVVCLSLRTASLAEAAARIAADSTLTTNLQTEIAQRIAGDSANQAALMTEVARAQNAEATASTGQLCFDACGASTPSPVRGAVTFYG